MEFVDLESSIEWINTTRYRGTPWSLLFSIEKIKLATEDEKRNVLFLEDKKLVLSIFRIVSNDNQCYYNHFSRPARERIAISILDLLMMISSGTMLKSNIIKDEVLWKKASVSSNRIKGEHIYILDHPPSRSSFLSHCGLSYFGFIASVKISVLLKIFLSTKRLTHKIIVFTRSENWAPCKNVLRRFGSRLLVVGRRFIVAVVVALGREPRPNSGTLPLVCLSRRVTDIVDRGLVYHGADKSVDYKMLVASAGGVHTKRIQRILNWWGEDTFFENEFPQIHFTLTHLKVLKWVLPYLYGSVDDHGRSSLKFWRCCGGLLRDNGGLTRNKSRNKRDQESEKDDTWLDHHKDFFIIETMILWDVARTFEEKGCHQQFGVNSCYLDKMIKLPVQDLYCFR